ncbi:hypothetical protein, partial [Sphingobacterium phlebotomi]|uniref:hypothetical protein n=1 Tax=Sphingobacterium phlebotomi TaxID=2605433 RepID=UPI001CA304E1
VDRIVSNMYCTARTEKIVSSTALPLQKGPAALHDHISFLKNLFGPASRFGLYIYTAMRQSISYFLPPFPKGLQR